MLTRTNRLWNGVGLVSPLSMVDDLLQAMDGFVDDPWPGRPARQLEMPIALEHDGDRLVIRADVPGVTERDVHVTYGDGTVSIRASRDTTAPTGWSTIAHGRRSFRLEQVVRLPAAIDADAATASLREGVLEIVLPKAAAAQPRRLAVRVAAEN